MSTIVKYSTGSTYTLVANNKEIENIQDVLPDHVPYTNQVSAVRLGLGMARITVSGDIEDKTACSWHDIVAISFDSGTSYQTVYFTSVSFGDDGWSSIYPFTLTLLASPLKEQTAVRYPTSAAAWYWGDATSDAMHQHGNVNTYPAIYYLAPLFYAPLTEDLTDFTGQALSFTRAAAKAHGGVSYAINASIFDGGLYIASDTSQDTPKWTPVTATVKTVACQIKQTRYPSNWVIGAGAGTANLLTANQSNAETDTTGMDSAGGTFTRTTTATEFYAGVGGFKNVSTGSNDVVIKTTTTAVAVTATQWYAASVYAKATAAAGRHIKIGIAWYTAADALISTSESAESDVTASFARYSIVGLAPATATKAYVVVTLVSGLNAEVLFVDSLMVESIPTSLTVWTAALNKLTISTTANTISWTDDTTTVTATFPTAHYMAGDLTDIICVDGTSHAVSLIVNEAGGGWTEVHTGTLAAIGWPELTLGNLDGSLSNLIEYPYALVATEWQALDYSLASLRYANLFIGNRYAETITKGSDGRLTTASGADITGLVAGADIAIGATPVQISQTSGLSARWYVELKQTDV